MSENLLPGSPAADQHQLNCTGMIFLGMIKILFAWFTGNNRLLTTKFAPATISFSQPVMNINNWQLLCSDSRNKILFVFHFWLL
jgi:hypothetical protein